MLTIIFSRFYGLSLLSQQPILTLSTVGNICQNNAGITNEYYTIVVDIEVFIKSVKDKWLCNLLLRFCTIFLIQ